MNALDDCPERFNSIQRDRDGDGSGDACELEDGMASDYNGNGPPDNCECIAGIAGNYSVDGIDRSLVLSNWGAYL